MSEVLTLVNKLRSLLDAGVARRDAAKKSERIKLLQKTLYEKNQHLKDLKQRLDVRDRELGTLKAQLVSEGSDFDGIDPANIVWIFCTGRSGSTWLSSMVEDLPSHTVWKEPLVGELFGYLYYVRTSEKHHKSKHFILGRNREVWTASIRSFVLTEAVARFPEVSETGYLVVKEPNGSVGAPLLTEALPESRIIFLIRDPRDTIASALDARKEGSWASKHRRDSGLRETAVSDKVSDDFLKQRAVRYLRDIQKSKQAYEQHEGPKTLVRYEDLRSDTLAEMRRLYKELGIEVDDGELKRVVEKHAWENIPEEEKGQGKFYRKARPGGWEEDLTPGQIKTVERITAPLLEEFYPG